MSFEVIKDQTGRHVESDQDQFQQSGLLYPGFIASYLKLYLHDED